MGAGASIPIGLENLVEDTTPQLGGDLDVNTWSIVSTSNGDINLAANGTGEILITAASVGVQMESTNYERFNIAGNLGFETIPDVSLAQAQAISLVENLAGGTLPAGEYHYDVTFLTDEGYSATINKVHGTTNLPDITVSANSSVTLNNIPISTSSRCTGRRIWRVETAGQAGTLCRPMYDINDNTTTSWTDDGSLTPSGNINYLYPNQTGGSITVDNEANLTSNDGYTILGYKASPNITGYTDVVIGAYAGFYLTSGNDNVFVGNKAGYHVASGYSNTMLGHLAGYFVTGNSNVWVGAYAYPTSFAGTTSGNTAVGVEAGNSGPNSSNHSDNTFIGRGAGRNLPGQRNLVLGAEAGKQASSGGMSCNYCIFVGANTGQNANGANYSILIGYDIDLSAAGADYELNIGNVIFGNTDVGNDNSFVRLGGDSSNYTQFGDEGEQVFVGNAGMVYGNIYVEDNATETTISVAGTAVQVTVFDSAGPSLNTTPDHSNDHITIAKAGDYKIDVAATVNSIAGAASRMELTVQKNNGASVLPGCMIHRNLAGGTGESGAVSITGIVALAADDTVEVWIENETNTQNYVIESISLSVIQLGG